MAARLERKMVWNEWFTARRPVFRRISRSTVVWVLLLVAASVVPLGSTGAATGNTTLLAHLAGYGVLAALLVRDGYGFVGAVIGATVVGAGIELVQWGLPYRSLSGVDVLVNLLGASIVATGARLLSFAVEGGVTPVDDG